MINTTFNNLCPFCNSKLDISYVCYNCSPTLNFYYNFIDNKPQNLIELSFYHNKNNNMYDVSLIKKCIYVFTNYSKNNYVIQNIPDFNSIEDLLSFINIYELFL